jgi:hypothetical protein
MLVKYIRQVAPVQKVAIAAAESSHFIRDNEFPSLVMNIHSSNMADLSFK